MPDVGPGVRRSEGSRVVECSWCGEEAFTTLVLRKAWPTGELDGDGVCAVEGTDWTFEEPQPRWFRQLSCGDWMIEPEDPDG